MYTTSLINKYLQKPLSFEVMRDSLLSLGFPVEGVEKKKADWSGVVISEIRNRIPHPNADKLSLLTVFDGTEELPIVCGATNMKEGDHVALARVGARLPQGFKIKKSKIRGETSFGMCCSEKELGLAAESPGILILPPDAPVGEALEVYLRDQGQLVEDEQFEVEVTTNRPDCLGFIGLARELGAKHGIGLKLPEVSSHPPGDAVDIHIAEPSMCTRYGGALIEGIQVGPSPGWLKQILEKVGLRSINNIVDVTNFILIESGHPIHAFDFQNLEGGRIVVRRATSNERLKTLDENITLELTPEDLVICDAVRPVALAGIMGGEESGIAESTTQVLIECAMFDPIPIRRSSRRHTISSDSSYRFERGVDETAVPWILARTIDLILEVGGGRLIGFTDVYPHPATGTSIKLDCRRAEALLGAPMSSELTEGILESLGFKCHRLEDGLLSVTVPGHRAFDVKREADLVEEVARVHGYEHIPLAPLMSHVSFDTDSPSDAPKKKGAVKRPTDDIEFYRRELQIGQMMAGFGFDEALNYAFISRDQLEGLGCLLSDRLVMLNNPLSSEQDLMRPSILPGLLQNVRFNLNNGCDEVRMYEIGTTFELPEGGFRLEVNPDRTPVVEKRRLAAVIALGGRKSLWKDEQRNASIADVRGVLDGLFEHCHLRDVSYTSVGPEHCSHEDFDACLFHPGIVANVSWRGNRIGRVGGIHPRVLEKLGIEERVFALDVDMILLVNHLRRCHYKPFSLHPPVMQDLSFVVEESVTNQAILDAIVEAKIDTIQNAFCFDIFRGSKLEEGKKSVTYSITYHAKDRTLTQDEVDKAHHLLIDALAARFQITLRT